MSYTQEELLSLYAESKGSDPEKVKALSPKVDTEEETSIEDLYDMAQERVASLKVQEPAPPEKSFVERVIGGPLQRSAERLSALGGRVAETMRPDEFTLEPVTEEYFRDKTDVGSTLLQVVAEPVSIFFDSLGETLVFGAEKGIGVVATDEQQQQALKYVQEFMQTEAGQAFSAALQSGSEGLQAFQEKYPNEAANLRAIADLTGAGLFKKVAGKDVDLFSLPKTPEPTPKEPFKISKIGLRKVDEPLAGDDKDLWNLAFNTGTKTDEQLDLLTEAQGPLRTNRQLATQEQLDVVDELKKAGVTGSMNPITANLQINKQLDALENTLIQMSRASDAFLNIPPNAVLNRAKQKFSAAVEELPATMNNAQAAKLVNRYMEQFNAYVKKRGNTAEGLREARKDFDYWLDKEGVHLGEADLSMKGQAGRIIRESVNETIAEVVPESNELLVRMNRLLKVKPAVANKARQTSTNAVGRYLQWSGFDVMKGRSALSQTHNVPVALGFAAFGSPFYLIGKLAKTRHGGKGRAAFSYAMRDFFQAIDKRLKTASPEEIKAWKADQKIVYAAVREAVTSLEEQYDREEEEEKGAEAP